MDDDVLSKKRNPLKATHGTCKWHRLPASGFRVQGSGFGVRGLGFGGGVKSLDYGATLGQRLFVCSTVSHRCRSQVPCHRRATILSALLKQYLLKIGGVNHCRLHCHLAKSSGLMRRGKYGAVIGQYVPSMNDQAMGSSSANHSAVFPPSHQTTGFRQTTV